MKNYADTKENRRIYSCRNNSGSEMNPVYNLLSDFYFKSYAYEKVMKY